MYPLRLKYNIKAIDNKVGIKQGYPREAGRKKHFAQLDNQEKLVLQGCIRGERWQRIGSKNRRPGKGKALEDKAGTRQGYSHRLRPCKRMLGNLGSEAKLESLDPI